MIVSASSGVVWFSGRSVTTKNQSGRAAQDGHIVRVDVNSVTPDVISGEGNGIGRDDEIAISYVDDGRVLANLGSNEEARIMLWQMPQQ